MIRARSELGPLLCGGLRVTALLVLAACSAPAADEPAPAARRYRSLTAHTVASVRTGSFRLDPANKPALYRSYPDAVTLPLPAARQLERPLLEALGGAGPAAPETAPGVDLELLATLLFLTGGVTGTRASGGDLRATAAAGALYPNELYVVTGGVAGLADGVYHYEPKPPRLGRLRGGDWRGALAAAAADETIARAPATVIVTGIMWRSAWKYRARAYRHLYWDGGMMLAHLLAGAAGAGLPVTALGAFVDGDVDRLVGADGRTEAALALVTLGTAAPTAAAPEPTTPSPLSLVPTPLSPHPIEYPEALRYHTASRLGEPAAVRRIRRTRVEPRPFPPDGGAPVTLLAPATASPGLDTVVRRRRSTRRFTLRPITGAELATVLAIPTEGAPADFLRAQPSLVETFVIVNAVTGVPPGAYRYQRGERLLAPIRQEDVRRLAGFLCLEQRLAHDASAVLFYLTDLAAVGQALGERGYRLAELEAGLLAGRAYLVAYGLGRGATGLTFYDDEVTRAFSPPARGLEPLLVVAIGVPARRR